SGLILFYFFFFSSRRRHTRCLSDWSSDVCSSDLFYRSADRIAGATMNVVMRTGIEANALAPTVQRIVTSLDPSLPINRLRGMDRSEERRVGKECRSRGSGYH